MVQGKTNCACGGSCPSCVEEGLATGIQSKSQISMPGDHYEQEADRVAEQVLRIPDPVLQRQYNRSSESSAPRTTAAEEALIGRPGQSASCAADVSSDFTSRLGNGVPLDTASRHYFEPRFGQDFSNVRIHDGPQAAATAASIQARAFTLGRDVVFAAGEHKPDSASGKRLLAHELTHVVQQSGVAPQLRRQPAAQPAPAPVTPASDADIRYMVNTAIEMFARSAEHFQHSQVNAAVLDRVLSSWAQEATTYTQLIQTRLNNDAALLQAFQDAFKSALTVLLTRAAALIPNTSVIQLYLANLYRLPEWARPNVGSLNLTTEAQRRAFITSLTNAFNLNNLFQGYATVDDATLQSILGYLFRLITDSQNLVATNLANDASLLDPLRAAYRSAVGALLSRASTPTGQTVQQLFMRYRYGTPTLIHEWADQQLSGITAAVPLGTSADPLLGTVGFTHNGFQIEIQPDGTQTAGGAQTRCNMNFTTQVAHVHSGNRITSFTPPTTPTITIGTNYGPGFSPSTRSGYGRGTTADDTRLGNTSLGYHERSHSRDYLRFINANPAPVFTGAVGQTREQFAARVQQYVAAMQAYSTRILRESELATDCVGTPNIVQFHTAAGTASTVQCP